MKKSKGQVELGAVPTLIVTLVVIAIVLSLGAVILGTMGTSSSFNPASSTYENITNIKTSAVVYNLTAKGIDGSIISGSPTSCNQTGNTALGSTNYTVYPSNATIVFSPTFVSGNASYCLVSYSYQSMSNAANATAAGESGVMSFADFQSVIAIVLVAAVILGLVGLIAFAGGRVV